MTARTEVAALARNGEQVLVGAGGAPRALTRGAQATAFWAAMGAGVLLPAALACAGAAGAMPAALLALAGWWVYGHAFVLAGQGPRIS